MKVIKVCLLLPFLNALPAMSEQNSQQLVVMIELSPAKIVRQTPSGIFLHGLFNIQDKPKATQDFFDFVKDERYQSELESKKQAAFKLYKDTFNWSPISLEIALREGESDDEWDARIEKIPGVIAKLDALDECEEKNDSFYSNCESLVDLTDYENFYQDPTRPPLSIQSKSLPVKSLADHDRKKLEEYLSMLMEKVRQVTIEVFSDKDKLIREKLHPVTVKVAGTGLNIKAGYGSTELIIPADVLRDIWSRALFRAIINTTVLLGDDFDNGVYARNLLDVKNLIYALPGMRYPMITKDALMISMKSINDYSIQQDWRRVYQYLESTDEQDISQIFAMQKITSILHKLIDKSPNQQHKKQAQEFLAFLETMVELIENEEFEELIETNLMDSYMPLMGETLLSHQSTSAELLKSFLFILAHESWHIWFTRKIGKKVEYQADQHAMRVYLKAFPEIDFDSWHSVGESVIFGGGELESSNDEVFNSILGRSPDVILNEIYKGTNFYEGNWSHPTIEKRVKAIAGQLEQGKLKFSKEIESLMECVLENIDYIETQTDKIKDNCYQK
jgi:hypothetical protein